MVGKYGRRPLNHQHKAGRAAFRLSCGACFEQPNPVYFGCGADRRKPQTVNNQDINRVGGKQSKFSSYFVFRPLTPPYMRIRIRRFLICNDTFRSIPTMTDSLLARGFYCSLRLALYHYAPLPSSPYSHYPIDTHAIVVSRI